MLLQDSQLRRRVVVRQHQEVIYSVNILLPAMRFSKNVVSQEKGVGETKEVAAGNQKEETPLVIPPTPSENPRLSTGNFLLT